MVSTSCLNYLLPHLNYPHPRKKFDSHKLFFDPQNHPRSHPPAKLPIGCSMSLELKVAKY